MPTSTTTWMVLARDVTGTITVDGVDRLAAALILDVDTGLVRGIAIEASLDAALDSAVGTALGQPAAELPPGPPDHVVTGLGLGAHVRTALKAAGVSNRIAVQEVQPDPDAEDVFDSFLGHMSGRSQPSEFPDPDEWRLLISEAVAFNEARPWTRWSDGQDFALTLPDAGYTGVVMGRSGIQYGLALYPGEQVPRDAPSEQQPPPVGTLLLLLDPRADVPKEMSDKAVRYGWPADADRSPAFLAFTSAGPAELGREDARRLIAGIDAVLTADQGRGLRLVPPPPTTTRAAPRRARPMSGTTRLRVTMRDVRPAVERIIDVPAGITLDELHDVLQVAIGWTDSHLHRYETDAESYARPSDDDWDEDELDERGVRLSSLPATFTYAYDFGDGWEHDVEVLGAGGPEPGCLGGEGSCPPEDCGGPHGYAELLEALRDKRHPEHRAVLEWVGDRLRAFDLAASDDTVRAVVGAVPDSVRILLDLLAGGVKLTPGGRLPRVLVRAVQEQRPAWYSLGRPASVEEDLIPLSVLHDMLREVGVLRLAKGVLRPTKAASDDREVVRRIRSRFVAGSFNDVVAELVVALLVARGPMSADNLAAEVLPTLAHGWRRGNDPLTERDMERYIWHLSAELRALDMVTIERQLWTAGKSARTVLPRVVLLADVV